MPQIRPITDLRNTNEISDLCHARREPVFITKNGYGDLVVMSIEPTRQWWKMQRWTLRFQKQRLSLSGTGSSMTQGRRWLL